LILHIRPATTPRHCTAVCHILASTVCGPCSRTTSTTSQPKATATPLPEPGPYPTASLLRKASSRAAQASRAHLTFSHRVCILRVVRYPQRTRSGRAVDREPNLPAPPPRLPHAHESPLVMRCAALQCARAHCATPAIRPSALVTHVERYCDPLRHRPLPTRIRRPRPSPGR